jgi:tetratricopeptide (TPR) repeat protein
VPCVRKVPAVLLLLLWAAVGARSVKEGPTLEPVPMPDLKRLEPAVAAQIEGVFRDLEAARSGAELSRTDVVQAFGLLGQLFHVYEFYAAAAACYRNADRLEPGNYRWLHLLADVESRRGNVAQARAYHEAALVSRPGDLPTLVELGEICLELDSLDEAERRLKEALRVDPSSAAARAGLGRVALARQDYAGAVSQLEAALVAVPGANRLEYSLGMAYRGLGNLEEARRHLSRSGSVGLRVPDPLVDGLSDLVRGERARILRGRLAFANGRYAEAVKEFEAAVSAAPDSVTALVDLGAALGKAGNPGGAIERLGRAIELAPDNITAHLDIGQLLAANGRNEEALPHLRKAADALPSDGQVQRALAEVLAATGHNEEALRSFALAARLDPQDEEAVLHGGALLVRLGQFREARSVLEAGHRRMPTQGRIAEALAYLLAACPEHAIRDGRQALELSQKVYAASPTPRRARTVALAYAELDRCREAAEWLTRQRRAFPSLDGREAEEFRVDIARYTRGVPCRAR